MKRTLIVGLMIAPLTAGAYPFIDGVNKMAHIPYHPTNVLFGTTTSPVDISLHRRDAPDGNPDRLITSAIARANRFGLPAQAVPVVPTEGCIYVEKEGGPKSCFVYDEKGNLHIAGGWSISFEICKADPSPGFGDRTNMISQLECTETVPATAAQTECFADVMLGVLPQTTDCR